MAKYKQKVIPSVTTPKSWEGLNIRDTRLKIKEYYQNNIQGKSVVNKHLGLKIIFTAQGKGKLSRGGSIYPNKAVATMILLKLLENAEYSNFSKPKNTDPNTMVGYFNFKAKAYIDGVLKHFRIATIFYQEQGKLFYNLELNK